MANTHLEHPEDTILTGDLSIFDDLYGSAFHIGLKMDGAPAIVCGTYQGKFLYVLKQHSTRKRSDCDTQLMIFISILVIKTMLMTCYI